MIKRRAFLSQSASAGLMALAGPAVAQTWPAKPITWVYAYAAGAGGDPIARILAKDVGEHLGQSIVVENRTGAAGMIGTSSVARAPADGYTFLFAVSGEIAINQWLYRKMTYDPQRDLVPVCLVVKLPLLLVASTASGIRSVSDLLTRGKGPASKLTYASPGSGTLQHLAAELLKRTAGIEMTHIPYRGVAAVTNDLLAGMVDVAFVGLPTALPHVRAGRLTAIGLSTATRAKSAPDLVPLANSPALHGFDLTQWFGLMAPAGTPAAIVNRMQREVALAIERPAVSSLLIAQGAEPAVGTPAQFGSFIAAERERFGRIIHDAKVTLE